MYHLLETILPSQATRVVVHTVANTLASYAPHGRLGWFIGAAPKYYCCRCKYFPDMMVDCNVLKVDFPWENYIAGCFSNWLSYANSTRPAPSAQASNIKTVRLTVIWLSNTECLHWSGYFHQSCLSTTLFQQSAPCHTSKGAHWNTSKCDPSPAVYPTSSKDDHSSVPCPSVLQPTIITHAQLCSARLEGCCQDLQSLYRSCWRNQHSSS